MVLHEALSRGRRAAVVADLAPQIAGRVGVDAGAAEPRHEQAADLQGARRESFRRQPEPRAAGQQPVGRVVLQRLAGRRRNSADTWR